MTYRIDYRSVDTASWRGRNYRSNLHDQSTGQVYLDIVVLK